MLCSGRTEYDQEEFAECLPAKIGVCSYAYPYIYESENYRGACYASVHNVYQP